MFLAVTRIPDVPDALQRAAAATGLVRADVQRRLAGILPRVVLVDADRDEIHIAQNALEAAGFPAIAFDPSLAPTDEDRRFARTLDLERDAMVVVSGVGAETRERVPFEAVALVQRALRSSTASRQVTTRERKLALGTAGALTQEWRPDPSIYRPGRVIALDLGNTNSCVAGYGGSSSETMFHICIPSWVAFADDGTVLVGEDAMNHASVNPEAAVSGFKHFLGKRY